MRAFASLLMAVALLTLPAPGRATDKVSDGVVRIGVLTDMTGFYSDLAGPGSVLAVQMAVEDYGKQVLGKPIEIVSADHQNKADIASLMARKWFDEGKVDIIVGTHRLLSKDVVFRDLGLLVVDEEQRFGVAHKEKIKQLRKKVDVLTMTATPMDVAARRTVAGIRRAISPRTGSRLRNDTPRSPRGIPARKEAYWERIGRSRRSSRRSSSFCAGTALSPSMISTGSPGRRWISRKTTVTTPNTTGSVRRRRPRRYLLIGVLRSKASTDPGRSASRGRARSFRPG